MPWHCRSKRFRHRRQLAELGQWDPLSSVHRIIPARLVRGGRAVLGDAGRSPLVPVPLLDAARRVRVDVGPVRLFAERYRLTLPGRGAALLTVCCPFFEGFVFHGVLPSLPVLVQSAAPSPVTGTLRGLQRR